MVDETQTGFSFIEFLTDLARYKIIVFGVPFFAVIIAIIVSLTMTPIFSAKAVIMPPAQQQSASNMLIDQLGPLAGMAASAAGIRNSTDLYVAFLKTGAISDLLVEKFDLQNRYRSKTAADAREELGERVKISSDKLTGLIYIEASDRDPKFAADLANAYIDSIRVFLGQLSLTEAKQRRLFFESEVTRISERPFRDVRIQEGILAAMMRQYEIARIDEARDGPLFQQIDVAIPPEHRSKPKRTMMVLIAGVYGLAFGVFLAWILMTIRRSYKEPRVKRMLSAWRIY